MRTSGNTVAKADTQPLSSGAWPGGTIGTLRLFARDIVKDGLVFQLDSGDLDSYPGSGNAWTDLASGITMGAQGTTMSLESNYGGAVADSFKMNGSGYWESTANHHLVDMAGECTLVIWYYREALSVRRTIFEKRGTDYAVISKKLLLRDTPLPHDLLFSNDGPGRTTLTCSSIIISPTRGIGWPSK